MLGTIKPNIFQYSDYRRYLKDLLEHERAQRNAAFSFRKIARRAGYSSSSFFKYVIDGKRNLTGESARRVAHSMGLDYNETEHLLQMVALHREDAVTRRPLSPGVSPLGDVPIHADATFQLGGLTLSFSEGQLGKIAVLVEEFRNRLLSEIQTGSDQERVFQLNLRLLPLSSRAHRE